MLLRILARTRKRDDDESLSEFSNPYGHGDQAIGVAVDSEGRIVAGGFHTFYGAEEPFGPGGGLPPSVVRFAAIRLIEESQGAPSAPNYGLQNAVSSEVTIKASSRPPGEPLELPETIPGFSWSASFDDATVNGGKAGAQRFAPRIIWWDRQNTELLEDVGLISDS